MDCLENDPWSLAIMPQRGIAYQPRVPTLGIPPEEETRVLKERRIGAGLLLGAQFPFWVYHSG